MTWTAARPGWPRRRALLQHGDLVFGWRLALKHQLLSARLALLRGDPADALAAATALGERAAALRVPRYTSAARLVAHRARHALRLPVDPAAVAADLDALDQSVSIEAWWWTGELAADFGQPAWLDRAAGRAARLAAAAGPYGDGLRQAAGQRLDRWRAAAQLPGQHAVTSAIDTASGAGRRPPAGRLRDGTLGCPPGRRPGRGVQAAQERGELSQAQPPGGQLGRGDQACRHGDGAHPQLG